MFKSSLVSLTAASLVCLLTSIQANAHPHDCECDATETIELQAVAAESEIVEAIPEAEDTTVSPLPVEQTELATEVTEEVVEEEQPDTSDEIAVVDVEEEPLNPEYYAESGLPIYTVQVIAVDHKRKAPVRARIVPKFYGPAEIIVENSKNPNRPKVYNIIAGRFEGYTAAKEATKKLCEPIYLNGCFVRRWEDVDKNRWVDPNAAEESQKENQAAE